MKLIGLDFGSTTSSMILASADVLKSRVTGRFEFGNLEILYRSEPVFTPFHDELRLSLLLDRWFTEAGLTGEALTQVGAGGAIITGLAAEKTHADSIKKQVRARMNEAVIVTAHDPSLESWVSFMGNCSDLSLANPSTYFLNLDIGGGTTNLALGLSGEVIHTSCHWIGARHFQLIPGTYQLTRLSPFAQETLAHLKIKKSSGDILSPSEIESIIQHDVDRLETLVRDFAAFLENQDKANKKNLPCITFSGGVGELIYSATQGNSLPTQTFYGDLGVNLAEKILKSPLLSANLKTHLPLQKGRATVYGLMLHSTQLSGSTLFLPHPENLPLRDLPILGWIEPGIETEKMDALISRAAKTPEGVCLLLKSDFKSWDETKTFGQKFRNALRRNQFPPHLPLVLLISQNIGKTLGHILTDWGNDPLNLMIIDEITNRPSHFLSLGALYNGIVTVSFYGSGLEPTPKATKEDLPS